jgi:hypothetical protein
MYDKRRKCLARNEILGAVEMVMSVTTMEQRSRFKVGSLGARSDLAVSSSSPGQKFLLISIVEAEEGTCRACGRYERESHCDTRPSPHVPRSLDNWMPIPTRPASNAASP